MLFSLAHCFGVRINADHNIRYNVDGFYVAKFKKTGPTPANARGGASSGEFAANSNGSKTTASGEDEMEVDKTPVEETEEGANDEFGGFDDDGDKDYMERAKRNAMRRRGLDPKALDRPKKAKKA